MSQRHLRPLDPWQRPWVAAGLGLAILDFPAFPGLFVDSEPTPSPSPLVVALAVVASFGVLVALHGLYASTAAKGHAGGPVDSAATTLLWVLVLTAVLAVVAGAIGLADTDWHHTTSSVYDDPAEQVEVYLLFVGLVVIAVGAAMLVRRRGGTDAGAVSGAEPEPSRNS